MSNQKRHQKIMNILNEKKSVSNQVLLESLFVSEATLRRDLSKLESLGLITRTHGHTHLKESSNIESSILIRSQKNVKEKKRIAQMCLNHLSNNSSIFIDSSSTVGYMLPLLTNYRDLTFITNGINNALVLSQANANFN
jgi:DeoR family fructose operon transcriptional repressor